MISILKPVAFAAVSIIPPHPEVEPTVIETVPEACKATVLANYH